MAKISGAPPEFSLLSTVLGLLDGRQVVSAGANFKRLCVARKLAKLLEISLYRSRRLFRGLATSMYYMNISWGKFSRVYVTAIRNTLNIHSVKNFAREISVVLLQLWIPQNFLYYEFTTATSLYHTWNVISSTCANDLLPTSSELTLSSSIECLCGC